MKIENEFLVKAPVETVWSYMLDVERIAPCAPGAELTEVVDDRTWKGKLKIKVGPIAMSFAGTVALEERDDQAHRAVLKAQGREERGRGAANATVTTRLEPADEGTQVRLDTDLTISGAAAQYGRGMIGDISQRLAHDFARCVEAGILSREPVAATTTLGNPERGAAPSAQPAAQPVKGLRLGVWAFWRATVRFFNRLFGRRSGP